MFISNSSCYKKFAVFGYELIAVWQESGWWCGACASRLGWVAWTGEASWSSFAICGRNII